MKKGYKVKEQSKNNVQELVDKLGFKLKDYIEIKNKNEK